MRDRLLTNVDRQRRGMKEESHCSRCGARWESDTEPSEGWVKVSSDGSVDTEAGISAIGGILRNDQEARAPLSAGIRLAWENGYRRVEVESDNALLINAICSGYAARNSLSEVGEIQRLSTSKWGVIFRHISRQQNLVADGMARLGRY
ncbi:hypothetical protein Goshw_012466 [Gossypium schwendimanii]|uniref:RNase H type-1 domain-containing protein n=1 Tax=Gossypium schwendimanii TaxID=34291 RepID=A0A7J9KX27_GOSSC|nr:hypothetical protein [Gossypium schwendimanii]